MYDEFIQKSDMNVTVEYYEDVIQPLYMMLPGKIINDATAFCNWIKNVGLDMAETIYDSYQIYAEERIKSRTAITMEELRGTKEMAARFEDRLAVYESVFSEEELRERLLAKMSTEDLITAYQIGRRE